MTTAATTDNLPAPAAAPATTAPASPSPAPAAANPDPAAAPSAQAPAPAPAPAPSKPLASGTDGDKPAAAPADWPDDWRTKLAGDDKALQTRLERFASPADLLKSYRALEQKLSSGEYKAAKPKDGASEEEIAQWRKENGIPEAPDKYEINLANGLVVGEQDKPSVDAFLKEMHGVNAPPETVNAALNAYYKLVEAEEVQLAEADGDFRAESEEALRSEWGADFKRNVNMVATLLDSAPDGVGDLVRGGRTAEGKKMGDDPAVMRWLANLAREINPASTVVPNGTTNPQSAIADEIAALVKLSGDRSSEYWKGPKAEKHQARLRELNEAQARLSARK